MEPFAMLDADPLDLLFENRNKLYGAYTLRKYYNQRLIYSFGIMMSFVILGSFLYLYFNSNRIPLIRSANPDINLIDLTPPEPFKPIVPPRRPSIARPVVPTIIYTVPLIINQDPPKPIANIEQLNMTSIGLKTVTGTPETGNSSGQSSGTPAVGNTSIDSTDAKPKVFLTSEIMPSFPGGLEQLKRFLLRNLHMPENNLEPGTQIHVVARFIVGEDGKVRDIEITVPADAAFNKEVKRVILKMPDWNPGMQNHRNVAVYFCLPVNFITTE